jgi:hypothetical protein
MSDQVPVTDADREAAKRFVYDYNVRDIFQAREGPIEDLADIIARARAEEREACALECEAVCPPAGLYTPGELSAYEAAVQDCAAAIRARSEGGKA